MSIKHKAVNAVMWSGIERLSAQLIRFAIGVILARLLLPAEFGLIGMLGIFMGVAQVFVNCGFGEGLIQKQNTTRHDESSVFYVNVMFGALAALGLYGAAPGFAFLPSTHPDQPHPAHGLGRRDQFLRHRPDHAADQGD